MIRHTYDRQYSSIWEMATNVYQERPTTLAACIAWYLGIIAKLIGGHMGEPGELGVRVQTEVHFSF